MALIVGNYDASTFVLNSYGTYPPLPAGVIYYEPTMGWKVTVAGTVQGQAVVPGDILFATQGAGRLFGDGTFGDQIFGGVSDGDWLVSQVFFFRWDSTKPVPDLAPYPNAGCAFTRADQADGDWAPGWRIVIDAYYNAKLTARTYGTGTFGSDRFGGDDDDALGWTDITQPGYRIETGDGTAAGGQRVPVPELVIELYDDAGMWFDVAEPDTWHQPQSGTPIRVGLISPDFVYHPVIVGEIERIEDTHDDQHPRVVTVRGFGRVMDLTVDVANWQRPFESVSDRFKALVPAAGWSWDDGSVSFPPGDLALLADPAARDIVVRDEIDRSVQAAGWMFDADRKGRMRISVWPHEPVGATVTVVDCWANTDDDTVRLSGSIVYANDQSSLLNNVVTTNTATPTALAVTETNTFSTARFGKRGRALDYPKMGLPWAFAENALPWARRIANRFAFITRHVEQLTADTSLDPGWLAVLADLDARRPMSVQRRGIRPQTFDTLVVGWRHVIEPGRWQSLIFTTTTTTSM